MWAICRQTVGQPYNEIPPHNENKWIPDTPNNMDECHMPYAKWKTPDSSLHAGWFHLTFWKWWNYGDRKLISACQTFEKRAGTLMISQTCTPAQLPLDGLGTSSQRSIMQRGVLVLWTRKPCNFSTSRAVGFWIWQVMVVSGGHGGALWQLCDEARAQQERT